MNGMFYDCKNLTNINLSSFNTRNVADMSCMFYGCKNLTTIDLSYFESEHLISFKNIFFNCFKLIEIRISRPFSQIIKQEIKENIHLIFI
jgi:surface protein